MSKKSAENIAVLVDGDLFPTVSRGRDAFADRMAKDSKVSPCGMSRIAYSNSFLQLPQRLPSFLSLAKMVEREKPGGQHCEMHAPAHSVSQISVSMKKSLFSYEIFTHTMRLFGFRERRLTSVNLREDVTFSCAAEAKLDRYTLFLC